MKGKKHLKLVLIFVVVCIFMYVVNIHSKDLVEYYDEIFTNNTFTIYTEEQIDGMNFNQTVYDVASKYSNQEYWDSNNSYSYLRLGVQSCNYENMTCNFKLQREKYENGSWSTEIAKEYKDITISIDADVDKYFSMVKDNKIIINYDESMFKSDDEKNTYINNYFNSLNSYQNNESITYYYDTYSKTVRRTDSYNGIVTKIILKKVDDVVFEYIEEPFSDDFKKLTSGILTLKTDSEITTEMLSDYIMDFSGSGFSFSIDGNIINNKVFIKMMEYKGNTSVMKEKHLVTLVPDANIDLNLFERVGYKTAINIQAEVPTVNINEYISNYFNRIQLSFTTDDGQESYHKVYDYNNSESAVIKYVKRDSKGNYVDSQFHKVPIHFVGYNATVSDEYLKKVGNEIVVRADKLDIESINSYLNHNPSALGCNEDYSYCDISLYDYENQIIEIHRVKIALNNTVSDEFKRAFNIKEDGSIDIIVGDNVTTQYLSVNFYDDTTQDSLDFSCDSLNSNNKKCRLTLRNYRMNISEKHEVKYTLVNSAPTVSYLSRVNESIDVYPGETEDFWNRLQYSYEYFSKDNKLYATAGQCDPRESRCPVMLINENRNLEIHNSSVNVKEGRSPEFNKAFPGDTIKLNSIYKNDIDYLYKSSMAYLMSKTKSWSYLDNYADGKGKVLYDGLESHTMNVEFAQGNEKHQKVVDDIVNKIGNKPIKITIDDLEFINNFYYSDDESMTNNYNSKIIYDEFSKLINNKHISYYFVIEGGLGGSFMQAFGGQLLLYYDGVAYATTNSIIETIMTSVLYVPSNTTNTKEAYVEAAQKRIDKYLGKNSGVVVSYSRQLDEDEIDSDYIDVNGLDGNVYKISYKDKTTELLIARNSSKMKSSTFNAVDVTNNVNVSSSNANYPSNTIVSSNKIKDSNEYKKLLKKLGLSEAEIIDINLYSPTIGDINNFSNVDFDVNVPINTELFDSENLYAYYIDDDGNIEEHPITLDEFMATFKTNHFSTYIIAEKVDDDIINPDTSDGIIKLIVFGCLSMVGLVLSIRSLKRRIHE